MTDPDNILDQISSAVVVTDAQWRIRYLNRSAAEVLHGPPSAVLGEHLLVAAARCSARDTTGEALRRLARITMLPPESSLVERVAIRVPDRRFLRVQVQRYCSHDGEPGYLFLLSDATREGEIDEMKSEFIAVASHEMRTPMTSIKGSLELLLGGYAGELPVQATELLGISLTAVDRLVRLINDLLDISKIESGKMEFHLDRLNVAECVYKSMRSLRALAEAHQVSIRADTPAELPEVMADRDRLEQVITNLLSNALKYSPPDSVVSIQARAVDNVVRVSVIDQGTGIPPDQLERVFDRFHQLKGAKKGSGLGLAICRALIEQQRGRIWAESEPGQGARFHFEIPLAPRP